MTYKQLVKNSVELQIYKYLSEKLENRYFSIENVEVTNDKTNLFSVDVIVKDKSVIYNNYTIHGYLTDYCLIVITMVDFTRTYIVDGKEEKRYTLITPEMLKTFNFVE